MDKVIRYILSNILEYFESLFNFSRESFIFYRYYKGGLWYKHEMSGELPNCYGSFWARYDKINKYTDIIKIENYGK